ncbi:hypothetical protein QR680_015280 [Steinernema hermaphroditum]|uniref:7TM GPCR serpentine receptor class x (Srx) domain-containing protein n=1 Tax=Steinernema hermaphroditum TaxID=289476 RepID=A0AA39H924_9BILA|nr:hypothetical protein QR680_015280 [Steinernema hermaphroditum]
MSRSLMISTLAGYPMNGTADNETDFVYGSELQGRGYATTTDLVFGYLTTLVGVVAFAGGTLNLYLIRRLKAFRNAFGFFWAVRTFGELGTDITFAVYAGPLTILQTTNIPPTLGIFVYQLSYTFAYIQCVMNLTIALNRSVAVWLPLRYKAIFNKKLCIFVAIFICCQALCVVTLYFIFPCQHIGYGPRSYSNVFVKCSANLVRDYSMLAYLLNKICFMVACCGTGVINLTTFCKIMYIRIRAKARYNNKEFKRDVRLFSLAVVQDILMTIIVFSIIFFNNGQNLSIVGVLLSYDGLILIYIFNNASMAFCNPECRRFLFPSKSSAITHNYTTTIGGISSVILPAGLPTLPSITTASTRSR